MLALCLVINMVISVYSSSPNETKNTSKYLFNAPLRKKLTLQTIIVGAFGQFYTKKNND